MTIWRMRIACWIPESPNTHSEYVIIISFPLQQWLHERASMLRYTYIARLLLCNADALRSVRQIFQYYEYLYELQASFREGSYSSPRSRYVKFMKNGNGRGFSPCNSGFPWQCYWSNAPYLFADFDPTLVRRTSGGSLVTCDQSGTLFDIGVALNSKALTRCYLFVLQISCG